MSSQFKPEDLFKHKHVAALDVSATHDDVACAVSSIERESGDYLSAIWLVPLDGSPPRQFTNGKRSDSSPRWSPDGKRLAFLSDRDDHSLQIYLVDRDGGEAKQLSHFTKGANSIEWSPDGKQLLVTCPIEVDPAWRGARKELKKPLEKDAPQVAWKLPYKSDGLGFTLDREIHLFTIDVEDGNSRQLTDGPFDVRSATWSPDGRRIAYARTREGRLAHRTDIWIMDVDGSNRKQITHEQANCQQPVWSPDGRMIVFTGSIDEGDAMYRLWLIDVASEEVSPLGSDSIEVESGETVHWHSDSSRIVLVVAHHGRKYAATVSVPDGEVTHVVTGDRQISQLVCTAENLVYCSVTPTLPIEVYTCDWQGRNEHRLTEFNHWTRERTPLRAELRSFEVPDGKGGVETIEGWLIRSADAKSPAPLLVDVHGGPASSVSLAYQWHVYWTVLCSRGWAVLALNSVGSSSYGREFADRLRGNWGELDLPQQLAAVDALQHEGIADERIAIAGKSYGGYLSAYAIGQTSRFRAAIVSSPVINLESHFGISDSGYYSDPQSMCGTPLTQAERYRKLSPIQHADKARTPTLILQGTEDERCPKSQSEELFATLMTSSSMPVEMVLYPGGDHHFYEGGKPSHRVDVVQRIVEWLERYIETSVESSQASSERNGSSMKKHQTTTI